MRPKIPVWDFWIRLGHWLIILGVAFQQYSGEDIDLIDAHATVGILLGGWVIFRLIWGYAGPKYARFSNFPISEPRALLRSIKLLIYKTSEKTPGHTTIGGLGVYALVFLIGFTSLSGMASSDDIYFTGPLASLLSDDLVKLAGQLHPLLSEALLILIGIHITAIVWHVAAIKEPLIKGMISGYKPSFGQSIGQPHPFSKAILLRGFLFLILCLGGAYGILGIVLGW